MSQTFLGLLALLTGAMVPLQLAFNGQLGTALRSPYLGALGVFIVGTFTLIALLVLQRSPVPSMLELRDVPATAWIGGLLATVYIVAVVFLVPKLGVGATAVGVIAGQLVAAMVLDHFGAFGATQSSISWIKLFGAGLVLAGAVVVKSG